MNKKRLLLYKTSLLLPIVILPALITGCNKSTTESYIRPCQNKNVSVEFTKDIQITNVYFYGFEFDNLPKGELDVTSTFVYGSTPAKTEIVNFDETNKTFNIKLSFYYCDHDENLTGNFNFSVNGKPIKFESEDFQISLIEHKKIISEGSRTAVGHIVSGQSSVTFTGFKYVGVIDSNVRCNFVTTSAINVKATIVNLSTEYKMFDIQLDFSGCSSTDRVYGDFEFYYNDNRIEYVTSEQKFFVQFYDEKIIVCPTSKSINVWYAEGTQINAVFSGFRCYGFAAKEDITISSAKFKRDGVEKDFSASVVDFVLENNTFSVKISGLTTADLGVWQGQITFKIDEKIEVVSNLMTFCVYFPVPTDKLKINTKTDPTSGISYKSLDGFADGFSPKGQPYNTLYIPLNVREIGENAFQNILNKEEGQNISYLYFDVNSYIDKINANAFNGCTKLTDNLTLPASLELIGENAFNNCSSFNGTLFIPNNIARNLKINANAFTNCQFTSLDLTQFVVHSSPNWGENPIFNGWKSGAENTIIVNEFVFKDETTKTNIRNKLTTKFGLPQDWTFKSQE